MRKGCGENRSTATGKKLATEGSSHFILNVGPSGPASGGMARGELAACSVFLCAHIAYSPSQFCFGVLSERRTKKPDQAALAYCVVRGACVHKARTKPRPGFGDTPACKFRSAIPQAT